MIHVFEYFISVKTEALSLSDCGVGFNVQRERHCH